MTDFNPHEELRKMAEADARRGGRKMSFRLQCAAFAALYEGVAPKIVGFAFKLSPQTVSYISGCLEHDPDPYVRETVEEVDSEGRYRVVEKVTPRDHNDTRNPNRFRRYQDVAREFEALGKDQFISRYMTPQLIDRLAAARKQLAALKRNGAMTRGPVLDADGYPNFAKMNVVQTEAWRDANPEKWRARFGENKPQTPIDKDRD